MTVIPPWNMSNIHIGNFSTEDNEDNENNGLSDGQLSRLGISNVPIYENEEQDLQDFEIQELQDFEIQDLQDVGDLEVYGTTNLHGNVNAMGGLTTPYLHTSNITTTDMTVNGRDIEADIGILKVEIDILKADIDIYRLDNNELKYKYQILEEKFQILEEKFKEN